MPGKAAHPRPTAVVFGEVLFDCFGENREVLGGAPFNVAWHLQGFGLHPVMISRIGRDERGAEVRKAMATWGMNTTGIEIDDLYPTGCVHVSVAGEVARFHIQDHQAYDRIEGRAALACPAVQDARLIYHGTLALRADDSWQTLKRVREAIDAPAFVDLNLRAPWWTPERVTWSLDRARWIKLNHDELDELTGQSCDGEAPCVRAAVTLLARSPAELAVITRGRHGALLVGRDGLLARADAAPVPALVDTVGAGDAFSAVVIAGLLWRWPRDRVLSLAARFAADVCGLQGARTQDRSLYARHLQSWPEEA